MRTLRLALLTTLLTLLVAPGVASAQNPSAAGAFLVAPSPGSSTAPHGGYFVLAGRPGTVLTQSVDVRNDSAQQLRLRLAPVDAVTGPLGGVSYGLDSDQPTLTGSWIHLSRTPLALAPGASAAVPFTVTVPAGAAAGEHLAGISVEPSGVPSTSGPSGGHGTVAVGLQTRRIVAVQVNLPGPAMPELTITGVTAEGRSDGAYLDIALADTGTELTQGTGVITLPDDNLTQNFSIGTFVPGTSIAYPIKWTARPSAGDHRARVEVHYGTQVADWAGTVSVGERVQGELANRQVTSPARGGGQNVPVVLLAAVAGVAVVLSFLGGIAVQRRRRR